MNQVDFGMLIKIGHKCKETNNEMKNWCVGQKRISVDEKNDQDLDAKVQGDQQ